jgi:hypothetical protein
MCANRALTSHIGSPNVVARACGAVSNLGMPADHAVAFLREGAAEAVTAALRRYRPGKDAVRCNLFFYYYLKV